MTDEFQVGAITQTHGIRGEVKVFPTTDDTGRFKKLKSVTADTGKSRVELHIASVKYFKQFVILKFKEYDNINDVEYLKGAKLMVDRANAISLKKDEFYIADLIGLKVVTDLGEDFGTVMDVLQTGANDVYVIDHNDTDILVPAIKDCIQAVDLDEGMITIHVMEGLL